MATDLLKGVGCILVRLSFAIWPDILGIVY